MKYKKTLLSLLGILLSASILLSGCSGRKITDAKQAVAYLFESAQKADADALEEAVGNKKQLDIKKVLQDENYREVLETLLSQLVYTVGEPVLDQQNDNIATVPVVYTYADVGDIYQQAYTDKLQDNMSEEEKTALKKEASQAIQDAIDNASVSFKETNLELTAVKVYGSWYVSIPDELEEQLSAGILRGLAQSHQTDASADVSAASQRTPRYDIA
ncbi:hypothetical protein [Candidatus Soleaferrea massiliensis]|uniref:hypothetical protein n=1 Tax=Candidatus Soleaferrea massiliensis TaxID=1470354 RepID=UPI00058E1A79|nr:hypothetical protein [Candidatus Soleaferrea massiliensis]